MRLLLTMTSSQKMLAACAQNRGTRTEVVETVSLVLFLAVHRTVSPPGAQLSYKYDTAYTVTARARWRARATANTAARELGCQERRRGSIQNHRTFQERILADTIQNVLLFKADVTYT